MDPQMSQTPQTPQQSEPSNPAPETPVKQGTTKGYGKRPAWQWVVIYLIIAVIVYGLVYLIFFHKGGSTGRSGGFSY